MCCFLFLNPSHLKQAVRKRQVTFGGATHVLPSPYLLIVTHRQDDDDQRKPLSKTLVRTFTFAFTFFVTAKLKPSDLVLICLLFHIYDANEKSADHV
jgi:hypothetical protein